jgi:hypothetical protein
MSGGTGRESGEDANLHRDAMKSAFLEHDTAPARNPRMLQAIRQICADAQRKGQGPERALVEFKLALANAANGAEIPLGPDRSVVLDQLVSTFIAELYKLPAQSTARSHAFDRGDATTAGS